MSELIAKSAFAIAIHSDYGDNHHRYTKIIGVALTDADAHIVLKDAFEIAKNAFIDYMRKSGNIVYRIENDEKVEDFVVLDNSNYKRISMYIPDDTAPFTEMVSVYIEETILYKAQPKLPVEACHDMTCNHDPQTNIYSKAGHWDLEALGFEITGKLKNMQKLWIQFWKNPNTGEVAIRLENSKTCPDRIFNNRDDGNLWFKTYIQPMHGADIIKI